MRLIDADAILNSPVRVRGYIGGKYFFEGVSIRDIEYAPTVAAAPVVRCKDCKKYFNRTCKLDVFNWKEEDFCSLGERKDVPNET